MIVRIRDELACNELREGCSTRPNYLNVQTHQDMFIFKRRHGRLDLISCPSPGQNTKSPKRQ